MINLKDCIELGFILKTHGVKGQLILKLDNISFNEIKTMESVFILINGLPVPFFIETYSEKNPDSYIIKLEDIASEGKAREFIDSDVFIEKRFLKSNKSKKIIQSYSGYVVIDVNAGTIGKLNEILDFDKNPVLQIFQSDKEILLPLQPEFILDINENKKEIYVSCPDGLLDLYL